QLLEHDATEALSALDTEEAGLNAANDSAGEDMAAAEQLAAEMSESLAETEKLLERLTAELAEWNAKKASLERGHNMAAALLETSNKHLPHAQARLNEALERAAGAPDVQACEAQTEEARELAVMAREAAAESRDAFATAETAERDARDPLEAAER